MSLRDFRIGWRFLAQEPAYSLVVMLGLSIGFAACVLLLGFVRFSWQYNADVPDVEHVYVIKQRFNVDPKTPWFDQAPLLLRNAALRIPGVDAATGYIPTRPQNNRITARVGSQLLQVRSVTVLPGFAEMLGLEATQGDLQTALQNPDGLVLTEAAAARLFGTTRAMGKTLQVEGKLLRVSAIMGNRAANTTIPFEAMVGAESTVMGPGFHEELLTGAQGWWGKLLIRLRPGVSPAAIAQALQQVVDAAPALQNYPPEMKQRLGNRKVMDIALGPLADAYFDRDIAENFMSGPGDRGDRAAVAGLGAIALLILGLAAVNYVNLATVRVLRRQREVGMRKVLGAGMRQLVGQFVAEALLVSLLATALGLVMAWLALPLFSDLMGRTLDGMFTPSSICAALAIGVLLGVATAIYPAWIAVRVRPTHALAGRPDSESAGGRQLRRMLTVLQMATAMGLASVTLAIAWQARFSMAASPGFDPAPLLAVELPEAARESGKIPGFVAELAAQPGIDGVARSEQAVGRATSGWIRDLRRPGPGGMSVSMDMKSVSANFFELYRLRPVAGRLFDPRLDREGDSVPLILDAIGARALGFATPESAVGQTLLHTDFDGKVYEHRVIGIAPEVRFHSLHEAPRATTYQLQTWGATLSVRASGDVAAAKLAIDSLWRRYFPDDMPEIHRADDILAANYADDARMAKLLAVATGVAIAIAAFGTYVLAAHTVLRRAREIVLRKLHGAGGRDIGLLIAREFGLLALVAGIVGLPVAAVAIERYLAGFVERAPIGWWTLVCALCSVLAVATAAIVRHLRIAVGMTPADALRT